MALAAISTPAPRKATSLEWLRLANVYGCALALIAVGHFLHV